MRPDSSAWRVSVRAHPDAETAAQGAPTCRQISSIAENAIAPAGMGSCARQGNAKRSDLVLGVLPRSEETRARVETLEWAAHPAGLRPAGHPVGHPVVRQRAREE